MNILHLAHRLPYPPNKGDKVRSYHQIAHLARNHALWCACFVDDPADLVHVDRLRTLCQEVAAIRLLKPVATLGGLWNLTTGGTFTEGFYQHLHMVRTLQRWNKTVDFDAVLVFSSGMAPYARYVDAPRKVVDFCDLDSQKWSAYARRGTGTRSRLFRLEARRLARHELEWLDAFDAAVVITDAEAADLRHSPLRHKVHTVSNGVDAPAGPERIAPPDQPVVGFVGAMDYPPNVDAVRWFVETAWPLIIRRVPGARFEIVGRYPTRPVRELSRVEGVEVIGEVEDVLSFVRRFRVSVAPVRIARGLQNKVLEAMAAATPVVLTSAAATGINAESGTHYLVADDPPGFADCVVSLLTDANRCMQLSRAARQYVRRHHCWAREMAALESLLRLPISSGTATENHPAAFATSVGITSQAT